MISQNISAVEQDKLTWFQNSRWSSPDILAVLLDGYSFDADLIVALVVDLNELVVTIQLIESQTCVIDRDFSDCVGDLRRTYSVPVCARINVINDLRADRGGWNSA